MDLDRTTVLISIRPVYTDRILAGTKTIEFRRRALPSQVKTAIIWRTGPGGGLVGKFDVPHQVDHTVFWFTGAPPYDDLSTACGVSAEDLIAYAGGLYATVWAMAVRNVERFSRTLPGKDLHPALHRPPQSWRYAPAGWETKVGVPA